MSLHNKVRLEVSLLVAQFLLGMAVNLIGEPHNTVSRIFGGLFLGLHILNALALVINAALIARQSYKLGRFTIFSYWGLGIVGFAMLNGVLTIALQSGWSSYLMAAAFIAALLVYGRLYTLTADPREVK